MSYNGTVQTWSGDTYTESQVSSGGIIINLTNASSDYFLNVGDVAYVNYTNATTVPCNVQCTSGEYEVIVTGPVMGSIANSNSSYFLPNRPNGVGNWGWNIINSTAGSIISGGNSNPGIGGWVAGGQTTPLMNGNGANIKSVLKISTWTNMKSMLVHSITQRTNTTVQEEWIYNVCTDSTTVWTSLGSLSLPFAQSGKILIRRVM